MNQKQNCIATNNHKYLNEEAFEGIEAAFVNGFEILHDCKVESKNNGNQLEKNSNSHESHVL